MSAWLWVTLGLVIAAFELATPGGFFMIFFGVAAVAVGLLQTIGLLEPAWAQWLAFPIIALASLRVFRRPLLARLQPVEHAEVDSLIGELALPLGDLPAGGHGKAEVRGALWNAHNVGTRPVVTRERCRVVAVNELELNIQPE